MLKCKWKGLNYSPSSYHIIILMSDPSPLVMIIYVSQSEKAAGPAVEETSKPSEQNKVCVTRSTTNHNKLQLCFSLQCNTSLIPRPSPTRTMQTSKGFCVWLIVMRFALAVSYRSCFVGVIVKLSKFSTAFLIWQIISVCKSLKAMYSCISSFRYCDYCTVSHT